MSLQVIGAGWSRTGTFSLRKALELLGLGPCYHMHDVFLHVEHHRLWRLAAGGKLEDWSLLFGGYRAVTDTPACLFWRELVTAYPEAKVILTVREPGDWYESMCSTVHAVTGVADAGSDADRAAIDLARELVFDGFFQGNFANRSTAVTLFEAHNRAVQREVPAERLLVHEISEGWAPLCEFLGMPTPASAFPKTNDRAGFRRRVGLDR